MANRFPLIVDTSDSNKIKEIPSGDNLQLSGNDIVGVVNITGSGTLTIDTVNTTNLSISGASISEVAKTGNYSDLINAPTNISAFTNDSNYITSGSNISVLTNDEGYLTTVAFDDLSSTPTTLSGYGITDAATSAQGVKADTAIQPGSNISTLNNDAGYITVAQVQAGELTVDVNNSGDLIGSVFGQDSTILVDGVLSAINLDETIRGHVVPRVSELYDIGSFTNRFKDAYINGQVKTTNIYSQDDADLTIAGDSVDSANQGNSIVITGGPNTGSGDGGDIILTAGSSVGGVNGSISLAGSAINVGSNIIPDTDVTYDLGSPTNRFKDLYLSGNTINLGGVSLSAQNGNFSVGLQAGTISSIVGGTPVTFDFPMGPYTTGHVFYTALDFSNLLEPDYVAPSLTASTSGNSVTGIVSLDDGGIYPAGEFTDGYWLSIGPADPQNEEYMVNTNDPSIGVTFPVRETTLHPGGGTFTESATHTAPNGESITIQYTLSRDAFGTPQRTINSVSQTGPFPSGYLYDSSASSFWYVLDTDPTALEWGDVRGGFEPDNFVPFLLMDNIGYWDPSVGGAEVGVNIAPTTIPQGQSASTLQVSQIINLGVSTTPPVSPVIGDIALADGTSWDPVSTGKLTLVIYLGAWVQIAVAP